MNVQNIYTYTDAVIAESKLDKIVGELEDFANWYPQFCFDDAFYDDYIIEPMNTIYDAAKLFHELAQQAADGTVHEAE